eukprot:s1619_g2.t1
MASHSDSGRLFVGNVELDPDQDSQVEVARDGVLTRAGMSDPKFCELYGKDFQAMQIMLKKADADHLEDLLKNYVSCSTAGCTTYESQENVARRGKNAKRSADEAGLKTR